MRTIARNTTAFTLQWTAMLAGALLLAHWLSAGSSTIVEQRPTTEPTGPSIVERLMERGECWTGDAPADVEIPGRALVDTGSGPRLVDSGLGFEIWEGTTPGHLYAFCR